MDTNKILKFIKEIRIKENLSQVEIAKRIGISTSFYGMLERGNRTMSVEQLMKIAEAYDCDICDFLLMIESNI